MTRADLEALKKPRTTEVSVEVDGEKVSFVISRIKVGQRKRLNAECIDQYGAMDLEHVARLAAEMCVVEPELTPEDIEGIDLDVFLQLSNHIAAHSNLTSLTESDPEEGSDVVKSFPVS
jgi:hypothetical protein